MGAAPCVELTVDPLGGVVVTLLAVSIGVARNSFMLASNVFICAMYVDGTAVENHGGRETSSRAAYIRLLASPVTEAAEAADSTDTASSLNTAGGMYADTRDWTETWKKYAGRVEVRLTLLYKTVVCVAGMPKLGTWSAVTGSMVP